MNEIIRGEAAIQLFGLDARRFNVVADTATGRILNQTIKVRKEWIATGVISHALVVELRFDDQCKNGHETFSITADHYIGHRHDSCGCLHDEIAEHFPALSHLIAWHLTSTDGPSYYLGNTVYFAGDRDCYGLRAGEFGPILDGKDGRKLWRIPFQPAYSLTRDYVTADEKPAPIVLEYEQFGRTGEGKARDLDAARSAAVWPEATDEELMVEPAALREALTARLPTLLDRFKADMLACDFLWPTHTVAP